MTQEGAKHSVTQDNIITINEILEKKGLMTASEIPAHMSQTSKSIPGLIERRRARRVLSEIPVQPSHAAQFKTLTTIRKITPVE